MSRYEAAFPALTPIAAVMDLATEIAKKQTGGGSIALAAWNVIGYGANVTLGNGEQPPLTTKADAPAIGQHVNHPQAIGQQSAAPVPQLQHLTENNFTFEQMATLREAVKTVTGRDPGQTSTPPNLVGSELSVFYVTYLKPLVQAALTWFGQHLFAPTPVAPVAPIVPPVAPAASANPGQA